MTSTSEEIESLIKRYEVEVDQIRNDGLKMVWYMRGGVSYEEVMNMSSSERKMINEIIKENLETTKNTKMPFF
jgi:hypothetical protein